MNSFFDVLPKDFDTLSKYFSDLPARSQNWWNARSKMEKIVLGMSFSFYSAYRLHCFRNRNWIRTIQMGKDTVLVTGASSGMGLVTALYLCDEIGFQVFACVRQEKDRIKILEMVKNKERMKVIILDVTKQNTIDEAVQIVSEAVGDAGLYGLFNNAGTTMGAKPLEFMREDEFTWLFDVNTLGAWRVTNSFLPLLRKAKGTIVNNTSVAGIFATPYGQPYSCTKFALESISDSYRREVRGSGVRVVVLECGFIHSSIFKAVGTQEEKKRKELEPFLPLLQKHYPSFFKTLTVNKGFVKSAQSAEVVAQVIDKAFRGNNPDTRYIVGGMTGMLSFFIKLPDKWLDFILSSDKKIPEEKLVFPKAGAKWTERSKSFMKDPFFAKYNYQYEI